MSKYSIVLINPPLSVEQVYGKYADLTGCQPTIGLCSLASYLMKFGYNVRIVDASVLLMGVSDVVDDIKNNYADLIGIYANTANYYVVAELVTTIRKAGFRQKIVVGGPHATFMPEETMTVEGIDYCVIGEGEETLLELVKHLSEGDKNTSNVDGIVYRTRDGQTVATRARTQIEDLDNLPFPAVDLLPINKYRPYLLQYKKLPYMNISSSRGCPHSCIFCNTPFGRRVRYHSPEYILDYIECLTSKHGIREICFIDDTFTLNNDHVYSICDGILKRNMRVSWYANARVDLKEDSLFKTMKKSGCWIVAVGAESGDQEILKLLKKNVTLESIKYTCNMIKNTGMKLKVFFILGNPGETPESIEKTITFARSLEAHYPQFTLMTPYPGSELWKTAEQYGSFDRSDFQKLAVSTSDPAFVPYGVTKEQLLEKQKEAFRRVYCTPNMIVRHLFTIDSYDSVKKYIRAYIAFMRIQKQ